MTTKIDVSCLCITQNEMSLLNRAVSCYKNQEDGLSKELIILCEDNNPWLDEVTKLHAEDIRVIVIPSSPKLTLGELRNISIKEAAGEYICQWDDDDWYHPERIESQYSYVVGNGFGGCFLDRRVVCDEQDGQLYLSPVGPFEGSVLMRRDVALSTKMYSSKNLGEDTDFIFPLIERGDLKPFHAPRLYVYTYHGGNAWDRNHWQKIFDISEKISDEGLKNEIERKP